jgi:hypothetical protein
VSNTKRALISLTGAAVLVSGGASATAAPRHHRHHVGSHASKALVTGHLNAGGYTVVAVGTNGKVTGSKARSFSLRPPRPSTRFS